MKDFRHTGRLGGPPYPRPDPNRARSLDSPPYLRPEPVERPNQMSFGEQVVEAIGEHIDARISYAETRRGPNAEYANSDEVNKTAERLQALLDKVRFAL